MLNVGLKTRILRAFVAWARTRLDELERQLPPVAVEPAMPATDAPALGSEETEHAAKAEAEATRRKAVRTAAHQAQALNQLRKRVIATDDPIGELKLFVGNVRTAEARGDMEPGALERLAAEMLVDAGLFSPRAESPRVTATLTGRDGFICLRCLDDKIAYRDKMRLVSLEEALATIGLIARKLEADGPLSVQEACELRRAARESIALQAKPLDETLPLLEGEVPDGEWAVRRSIATGIEGLQLPYRLAATYRTNVADGNVAFRVEAVPALALPTKMLVDGIGSVTSTRHMREEAASRYSINVALLLASLAFRASTLVRHVWVLVEVQTPLRRMCQLCVDFDRWRFEKLDLSRPLDLEATLRSFAANARLEEGVLRPVEQSFSIDEPRFCPVRRGEFVSLSSRKLSEPLASALGTDHVSGLSVREGDYRSLVATNILLNLTAPEEDKATEKNVRTILEIAGNDPDPTVRDAAERTIRQLVSGNIDGSPASFLDEFTQGDSLSRAVEAAREAMAAKDFATALESVVPVITSIDDAGLYADSPTVEWRHFDSFVERTVYNRLNYGMGKTIMLVPGAYYEAQFVASVSSLLLDRADEALAYARRAVALAPLDAGALLHLTKCLEKAGHTDEAVGLLKKFLLVSYDPLSAGLAYYRLAYFMWHAGSLLAAQACYACAIHFMPQSMPQIGMELSFLAMQHPDTLQTELTPEKCMRILEDNDIPVVPSPQIRRFFLEGMRASVDAEIFPVARNFAAALGAYEHDTVTEKVLRSLEETQDQADDDE